MPRPPAHGSVPFGSMFPLELWNEVKNVCAWHISIAAKTSGKICYLKVNKSLRSFFAISTNFRLLGNQRKLWAVYSIGIMLLVFFPASSLWKLIWFIDSGQLEWLRARVCVCLFEQQYPNWFMLFNFLRIFYRLHFTCAVNSSKAQVMTAPSKHHSLAKWSNWSYSENAWKTLGLTPTREHCLEVHTNITTQYIWRSHPSCHP